MLSTPGKKTGFKIQFNRWDLQYGIEQKVIYERDLFYSFSDASILNFTRITACYSK